MSVYHDHNFINLYFDFILSVHTATRFFVHVKGDKNGWLLRISIKMEIFGIFLPR